MKTKTIVTVWIPSALQDGPLLRLNPTSGNSAASGILRMRAGWSISFRGVSAEARFPTILYVLLMYFLLPLLLDFHYCRIFFFFLGDRKCCLRIIYCIKWRMTKLRTPKLKIEWFPPMFIFIGDKILLRVYMQYLVIFQGPHFSSNISRDNIFIPERKTWRRIFQLTEFQQWWQLRSQRLLNFHNFIT